MTKQLSKAQINTLKVFLADYGVNVSAKRQAKQKAPLTAREVCLKSKWYPKECAEHTRKLGAPYSRYMRLT